MKFQAELLRDSILEGCSNEEDGITFIEDSGWEVDHKSQSKQIIFQYGSRFYGVTLIRTGDDWSGYDTYLDDYSTQLYDASEIEAYEVEKVIVMVHEWAAKQ